MSETPINAADNPHLAQALIAEALAGDPVKEKPKAPEVDLPFDTHVTLPGGVGVADGSIIRDAEVRELNGLDEEAISRAAPARVFDTILTRGVASIGGEKPAKGALEALLVGDRDALLLAIRCATYGPTVKYSLVCPECQGEQATTFDLRTDVPVRTLSDTDARLFEVELSGARTALVALPTGAVSKALSANSQPKTQAEINTLVLSTCVREIDEMPIGLDAIRALSIRDRNTILAELGDRLVGPRLEEVSTPCINADCGIDIPVPLDLLGDLFRF